MQILWIRHGQTQGNVERRYVGRTDEKLTADAKEKLKVRKQQGVRFEPDLIYVSPMIRCRETADILFPDQRKMPWDGLQETDFGDFEYKNYEELKDDPVYQAWIDSNGTLPFPNGESMDAFKSRCLEAFARIVEEVSGAEQGWIASGKTGIFRAGIVVHGGTIMAILEQYGYPKAAYFDYQVKNGCGYRLTPVEGTRLWNCLCLQ